MSTMIRHLHDPHPGTATAPPDRHEVHAAPPAWTVTRKAIRYGVLLSGPNDVDLRPDHPIQKLFGDPQVQQITVSYQEEDVVYDRQEPAPRIPDLGFGSDELNLAADVACRTVAITAREVTAGDPVGDGAEAVVKAVTAFAADHGVEPVASLYTRGRLVSHILYHEERL